LVYCIRNLKGLMVRSKNLLEMERYDHGIKGRSHRFWSKSKNLENPLGIHNPQKNPAKETSQTTHFYKNLFQYFGRFFNKVGRLWGFPKVGRFWGFPSGNEGFSGQPVTVAGIFFYADFQSKSVTLPSKCAWILIIFHHQWRLPKHLRRVVIICLKHIILDS